MDNKICNLRVSDFLKNSIPVKAQIFGSSMLPFIRSGDYLVIQPIAREGLRIGDILAYSHDNKMPIVCHRLVKIENSKLIIKGDTRIRGQERILFDDLLGKVIAIERGSKKIDLETRFQKALAVKLAWISLSAPALLYISAHSIEVVRNPKIFWHKTKRGFKRFFSLG